MVNMLPLTVTSTSLGSTPGISARTTILSPSMKDSIAGSLSSAWKRSIITRFGPEEAVN